jgi:hypothetical protein
MGSLRARRFVAGRTRRNPRLIISSATRCTPRPGEVLPQRDAGRPMVALRLARDFGQGFLAFLEFHDDEI